MKTKGCLVSVAIIFLLVGGFLYHHRCEFPVYGGVTPKLESGSDSCSLVDLEGISRYQGYYGGQFELARETGDGQYILTLTQQLESFGVQNQKEFFRIRFTQPAQVESAKESDAQAAVPVMLYRPRREEAANVARVRATSHRGLFDKLFFADHRIADYADDGFTYRPIGLVPLYGHHSPSQEFLVLPSMTNTTNWLNDTYFEIFRRRDHARLAAVKVHCCGYAPGYAVSDFGWLSDHDFLYVTGETYSQCLICRFKS